MQPDAAVPRPGPKCYTRRRCKGDIFLCCFSHNVHTKTKILMPWFSFLFHFLQSVQSVVSNLLISHIELRSDESPDIRAYSHQRNVEKVVVPLGEILSAHQTHYLQVGMIQVAPFKCKILFWSSKLKSPSEFK